MYVLVCCGQLFLGPPGRAESSAYVIELIYVLTLKGKGLSMWYPGSLRCLHNIGNISLNTGHKPL